MSVPITAAQARAARAMLGWSLLDLAKAAGLSISSVKRLKDGRDTRAAVGMVQDALETERVRFLADEGNGPGVRLQSR